MSPSAPAHLGSGQRRRHCGPIDPVTNRVVARIAVGQSPQAVTVADGRAWATVDPQTIRPVTTTKSAETLRIDAQSDVDYMDPAVADSPLSWQLLYATCAKLLNYPDKPGAPDPSSSPRWRNPFRQSRRTAAATLSPSGPVFVSRHRRMNRSRPRRSRPPSSAP